ncbi:hypothetical protein WN51_03020 [Melipona quadrifasciata]|uniref:Uncharacterized protein n=1 Tax=Melipona quadrifasciata TaxID=166423 RepID=A0A0M8ZVB4_9HYME|nr:hypothetical protein WN51_03020 [Melipona quadrifasciata]
MATPAPESNSNSFKLTIWRLLYFLTLLHLKSFKFYAYKRLLVLSRRTIENFELTEYG